MVEEISDREFGCDLLVHERQVGDPRPHWLVQGQGALVDETPDDCGGVGLGEGADLKKRLRGDRTHRREAGEAGRGVLLAAPGQEADRGAGNPARLHRGDQRLDHGAELWRGVGGQRARRRQRRCRRPRRRHGRDLRRCAPKRRCERRDAGGQRQDAASGDGSGSE